MNKDLLDNYFAGVQSTAVAKPEKDDLPPHDGKPLQERVDTLLKKIPYARQVQGLLLEELRVQLRGKIRRSPHGAEVAKCLRAKGWFRRRDWQSEVYYVKWYPPGVVIQRRSRR